MTIRIPEQAPSAQPRAYADPIPERSLPAEAFGIGGQGLAALGQGVQNAARQAMSIAVTETDIHQKTLIAEQDIQFRDYAGKLMYDPDGFMSKHGPDAWNALPGLEKALDDQIETQAATLPERAQQVFRDAAADRKARLVDDARGYARREHQGWVRNTSDARLGLLVQDAAGAWSNDTALRTFHDGAAGELLERAEREGWAPEQTRLALQQMRGTLFPKAIENALTAGDTTRAQDLLNTYGPLMEGANTSKIKGQIAEVARNRTTGATLETIKSLYTAGPEYSLEEMIDAIGSVESGNRDYNDDGTVVTSKKGAKGLMQVMDATARNPGFAVRPAADGSVEELNRVGRDLFQALLKHYGNRTLAFAAYNGGAGTVDTWISRIGDPRTGEIGEEEFLARMPFPETRTYVEKVYTALSEQRKAQGGGADPLARVYAYINGLQDKQLRDTAFAEFERWRTMEDNVRQKQEEQLALEGITLADQGVRPWEMPPRIRQGAKFSRVLDYYRNGKAQSSDPELIYGLEKTYVSDRKAFMQVDLLSFLAAGQLTEEAFREYSKKQSELEIGRPSSLSTDKALSAAFSDWNLTDKAKQEKIRWLVEDVIAEEVSLKGRPLTYDEQRKIVDRMVLKIPVEYKWWFGSKKTNVYEIDDLDDLPEIFLDSMKEKFPYMNDNDLLRTSKRTIANGGYERFIALTNIRTLEDLPPEDVSVLRSNHPGIPDDDILKMYKDFLIFGDTPKRGSTL